MLKAFARYIGIVVAAVSISLFFLLLLSPEGREAVPSYCTHLYTPQAVLANKAGGDCSQRMAQHPELMRAVYLLFAAFITGIAEFFFCGWLFKKNNVR